MKDNTAQDWKKTLSDRLPLLGHRNWIVVVDAAYPDQISSGIETLMCDEPQEEAVKTVIDELNKQSHVRSHIFIDKELSFVSETDASGVTSYRNALNNILPKANVETLLHEDIISMLDEAGKTFKVLLIKTKLTIPYTSVFFRLECGYWSDDAEVRMREAMKK
ncbi:MAG: hypothetical protein Q8908_10815 [Bacteroidota bacterium]|nr:hypothetical protein [Bacteroidota bacterium]